MPIGSSNQVASQAPAAFGFSNSVTAGSDGPLHVSVLTGDITLNTNATSTTISINGLLSTSLVLWTPLTANAAAINPFLYLSSVSSGQAVLRHPSNSNSDLTFRYLAII